MRAQRRPSKPMWVVVVGVLLAALVPSFAAYAEPTPARALSQGQEPPGPAAAEKKAAEKAAQEKAAKKSNAKSTKKAGKLKVSKKKTKKPGEAKKANPSPTAVPGPKAPKLGAADTLPGDYSSSTPQTMRDNIVGDFRGVGYEQRMRVENDQLVTRDPAQQGGRVTSVTTDLAPAPANIPFSVDRIFVGDTTLDLNTYSQYTNDSTKAGSGNFGFIFNKFHINTVYLAHMDGYVYMLGTQGNTGYNPKIDTEVPANNYKVRLYKISLNQALNGCAKESCAAATFDFPVSWNLDGGIPNFVFPYLPRAVGPSSLAVGKVGGKTYIAVGLTDWGVYIVDANTFQVTDEFTGFFQPDSAQMVPTALAWDPAGSGLLAVGVTGRGSVGHFVWVNDNGKAFEWHTWPLSPGDSIIPTPMTATILDQPDDPAYPKVGIFGLSDGTVAMVDPAPAWANTIAGTQGAVPGLPVAINPIPRVDRSDGGGSDFAVSWQDGTGDVTQTLGGVLRWPAGSNVASLQPIAPNSATSVPTAADFDAWYPGLKQGRLSITNDSQEEIEVRLQSSSDSGKGCWYAPAWADSATFPDTLTLGAGQTSGRYVIGYQSSGADGSCFTTDAAGVKRANLVITPTSRPSDQQILTLRVDTQPQLKVSIPTVAGNQAGSGSTTATLSAKLWQAAALGSWNLTVKTSDQPTPAAAPQVSMAQLTPGATNADNPLATSPVYRLNINPVTWSVPGLTSNTSRRQAVIPPLDVQGSTDGTTWTSIGSFLPTGAVNYNTANSTATTSAGSVFWENTDTASYTSLRVVAGTGAAAKASDPMSLTTEPLTPAFGVSSMTAAAKNTQTTFTPNGIDSYPLGVTITLDSATPPAVDPTQSVYYRMYQTRSLITNLYVAGEEGSFVGVQPTAGAYPNSAASAKQTTPNNGLVVTGTDYFTTTSKSESDIAAVIWAANKNGTGIQSSSALKVTPTLMTLQVGTTTAAGFTVDTCAVGTTGSCGVADIAPAGTSVGGTNYRAAVYQAGTLATQSTDAGPPLLGILFNEFAIADELSLPYEWKTGSTPGPGSSEVTVNTSTDLVSVTSPGNFPSGTNILVGIVSRGLYYDDSVHN